MLQKIGALFEFKSTVNAQLFEPFMQHIHSHKSHFAMLQEDNANLQRQLEQAQNVQFAQAHVGGMVIEEQNTATHTRLREAEDKLRMLEKDNSRLLAELECK